MLCHEWGAFEGLQLGEAPPPIPADGEVVIAVRAVGINCADAIMVAGRIVRSGTPSEMIAQLEGRVWQGAVDKADLAGVTERHQVIATRLRAGRPVVHVLADSAPLPGFEAVPASLEDVYFATLRADRAAAVAA